MKISFSVEFAFVMGPGLVLLKKNSSENMIGKFTFERILIQIEVEIEWMMKDVLQNNSLVCIEYMVEDEEEGISIEVFHNNLFLS